ncbi:hypothetical protein BDZ97DRAFT_88130 [Flammula alnicola]|nr:hypothetical protein BDZ97DRAFT_88130 [Flammula alnicola]
MTLNLRANLPVDDGDSNFSYSPQAAWQVLTGSSRQRGSAVHSTNTNGATVSFRFQGQGLMIYDTVPSGGGDVIVDVALDGGTPTRVTRTSGSASVFNDVLYQSSVLPFAIHTIVITNRGQSTDASFQFDWVDLQSDDINPSMTTPPPPATSAAPAPTSNTPAVTSAAQQTPAGAQQTPAGPQTQGQVITSKNKASSISGSLSSTVITSESTTVFLTTNSLGNTW